MNALEIRDLMVRYGDVLAVDRVSFAASEGEFVSLLGPSGCGKTTTLRCIAGLESASSGEIRIGATTVARDGHETPPEQRGVNMVFQAYAVWPHRTEFENVADGLRTRGDSKAELARRVAETLQLVGLSGFAERYGTELSGGQQQRVAVARAVITEPHLLLFDEPLSNLDAGLRERMRFELLALQRRLGRTSIYVTHDQQEAMAMSDRIILMDHGRIVQLGAPRDLYERPANRFAASFIGNANLLTGQVTAAHGEGRFTVRLGDDLELSALAARPGWTPDSQALVCIRPENISLDSAGFAATTTRVSYLGAMQSCEFAAGPLTLRADLPARTRITAGEHVRLHIDPASVVLVPET